MACRNRKSREKPGNFDYERTKCEDSDFRMEDLHKPGGGQQARGAPGRAAGAWAAGQQRRPHQRLRPSQARGRAAGEQQARGAPGRAAEAGKAAEGSLEEKGRGGRDEATALLAALHLPVKSLFLIFVPHLCLLRIVHTPCFLFAPETFATGWGQPHKPQTLPLTSGHLALSEDCSGASAALCSLSHNQLSWPLPALALQTLFSLLHSHPSSPRCPLTSSACALQVEGRGGGQHRRSLTPLPCGRAGHLASSEDGALPLAATRESIGPERGREHSSMGGTVASRLSFTPPPLFHPLLRPEEGREHWSKGGTEATLLSSSPPSLRLPPPHFPTRLRHHGATQGT
ncbi:unnamed protein product [Closterium sp. NIES-64]|nr:unnamed protein product [Closterium sp. NIES-64]